MRQDGSAHAIYLKSLQRPPGKAPRRLNGSRVLGASDPDYRFSAPSFFACSTTPRATLRPTLSPAVTSIFQGRRRRSGTWLPPALACATSPLQPGRGR